MAKIPYRFYLSEEDIPKKWYNIRADMKEQPEPMINPGTMKPAVESDLYPVFCEALAHQEMDATTRYFDIPEPIMEMYRIYRPSPLIRAYNLGGNHRDRCWTMGDGAVRSLLVFWITPQCIYGESIL